MIKTEVLYDMLPQIVEVYEKLDVEGFRNKMTKENKAKKIEDKALGIKLFLFVLKSSQKIKKEVFEIVSVFENMTVEEVKAQSFGKTIATLKEILQDEEAVELFKSAVK